MKDAMPRILITTDYLTPGDEVDTYLNAEGFSTGADKGRDGGSEDIDREGQTGQVDG